MNAKMSFWQRLQQERLPTDDGAPRQDSAEILRLASEEAAQRGVDVETILRERPDGFVGTAAEPTGQLAAAVPTLPASAPFSVKERADVESIIRTSARAVAERAAALDGASVEAIVGAFTDSAQLDTRWRNACSFGASSEALEEAVRSNPFMTPTAVGETDFVETLLLDEVLTFRSVKASERAPVGVVRLAHLHAENVLKEADFSRALARYAGLEFVESAELGDKPFPDRLARAFGASLVKSPTGLSVAVGFAPGPKFRDEVRAACGDTPIVIVTPSLARSLADEALRSAGAAPVASALGPRVLADDYSVLRDAMGSNSAIEMVRMLFEGAIDADATDIHIERSDKHARVRYRIDGVMHTGLTMAPALHDEVVSRIKLLAGMDITERRRPQDGHIRVDIRGRAHDLRIATVAAKRGEKAVIRVASTGRVALDLNRLGFEETALEKLRDVVTRPHGMVLATGPVGSGKTTTLYAALNEFDRNATNVATIEDPVEIELPDATQVEVNYSLGVDFATGLKALLRQDPDTLLIGEIRDEETAKIAARAAMTGRMVFSSLHANDSVGAITVLRNFGLLDHQVASVLQGVVAQRLVRRLCPSCKRKGKLAKSDREMLKAERPNLPARFTVHEPVGCADCHGTGYAGRIGVFEVLRMDADLRKKVLSGVSEVEIREYAEEHGLRTMQDDAFDKIASGETSVGEFRRVLRF